MKKLRAILPLALLVAAASLLAACNGGDDSPSDSGKLTQVVRERDGVTLKLSVDREEYGPGDTVEVDLEIENTNDTPVEYRGRTGNQPGLTINMISDLANPQALTDPAPEDISGTLGAGDRLERSAEWDKTIEMSATPLTAPPGTYTIAASFLMFRAGFADPIELAGAVTFRVEGTPYVQPPVEAVRALVNSEEIKAWAEGRGDNIICAYPPHGYFYNGFFSNGAAAETFDFLYRSQTENGLPICGIATQGEAWLLTLFSAKGGEPNRLSVLVALGSPDILEITEGGPTPVPTSSP